MRGRLCSSTESLGASTPTARQMADSSARAICTAVAFGWSRLRRAHSRRFLNGPSMSWNVSWRKCPVSALLRFIWLSVMMARYLPAGRRSKSVDGWTWLASNPRRSAMGLGSFFLVGGKDGHERRPRQRQVVGDPVTVLGDARGAADTAQDA